MKSVNFLKLSFLLGIMVSFLIANVLVAEAQRGQSPRGQYQQQEQDYEQDWGFFGQERGMRGPGAGMMPGMGMQDIQFLPGLTEEQREEIRSIQREARREHRETMLDMMDYRDDFMDAIAEDRPDPQRVRELHEAMSEKQAEMIESSIETRNRIYDQLTEEQREELREIQRRPFGRHFR